VVLASVSIFCNTIIKNRQKIIFLVTDWYNAKHEIVNDEQADNTKEYIVNDEQNCSIGQG
jgi:hypothetical protein